MRTFVPETGIYYVQNSTIYDIIIYPMLSADSRFWLANNHEV